MGMQEKNVMQRWFDEVWNERRDATIDELMHPDATAFGLGEDDPGVPTPELFRRFHQKFCAMFPNLQIRVVHMISEGEDVAMRLECEGNYAQGRDDAPPVKFGAMVFGQVRDGQIINGWNLIDESAIAKGITAATAQ